MTLKTLHSRQERSRIPVELLCLAAGTATAQQARSFKDVVYATVNGKPIALDLYLPANVQHPPLVVYLHGGAWKDGDKTQYPAFLVERGFAVASLDFRSTNVAPFPANVHDIKAGIRFLRAKAAQYGYRPDRIALAGASSGAHLANEVGMTGGNAELEGTHGRLSRAVFPRAGHRQLLRRVGSHHHTRAIHAVWRERARAGAGAVAGRAARQGAGIWRGSPARSSRWTRAIRRCCCCTATRTRRCRSTSRMNWTVPTGSLGSMWISWWCTAWDILADRTSAFLRG